MSHDSSPFTHLIATTRGVLSATEFPAVLFFDDARRNLIGKPNFVYGFILRASGYDKKFAAPQDLSKKATELWNAYDFDKTYDASSGLTISAIHNLRMLLPNSKVSCVVFDWDLTLSQHRAIIRDAITKKKQTEAAECFFGGRLRMQELKKLFRHARCKRIPVRIVTSNPAAKDNAEPFKILLSTICASWIPIVYASEKMKYVKQNHEFFRIF